MTETKVLNKRTIYSLVAISFTALLIMVAASANSSAAELTRTLVRFDRMKTSTATTGTVCAQPTTVATEASMQVVFPAGYTVSTTVGNWTVNTTNVAWPTGAIAWPGINTATAAVAQTVSFPSTDLTAGTLYCFNWTTTLALSVTAVQSNNNVGTVLTRTSAPATIDSSSFSTASITDDQIIVSATVPQTFSFALSANTDSLGSLSTGSVISSPTPRTATVNTNAKNGWLVWARDSNTGLNSASAAYTIVSTTPASNSTLSAGTEGYNMGATSSQVGGTGAITIATPFVGVGAGQGGGLNTTLATVATSNGTANTAVLTLRNNAAIAASTPAAADYTDTITVVGAGLF